MFDKMTVDEAVAQLRHSDLPTVLVEGKSDILVYRKLEKVLGIGKVDFQECGGRAKLLKIFERRREYSNVDVFFLADQDLWIFTGKPDKYSEVYTTLGYCIENDLYIDGEEIADGLLEHHEVELKEELIRNVSKWFACEVRKMIDGRATDAKFSEVKLLNESVIERNQTIFKEAFLRERGCDFVDTEFEDDLHKEFKIKLSGKFIFQIYLKIFKHFREQKAVTFTPEQLREICLSSGLKSSDSSVNRIISSLKAHFNL